MLLPWVTFAWVVLAGWPGMGRAALPEVLVVAGPGDDTRERAALWPFEVAASHYGVPWKGLTVGDRISHIPVGGSSAVVLTAPAAGQADSAAAPATGPVPGDGRPWLLVGITPDSDPKLLSWLSDGVVRGCDALPGRGAPVSGLRFGRDPVLRELAGRLVRVPVSKLCRLRVDDTDPSVSTLLALEAPSELLVPVFVRVRRPGRDVFFLAGTDPGHVRRLWETGDWRGAFAEAAPHLVFLRALGGRRIWQAPRLYANLTIDDPWLREPYGLLSYRGLVSEMRRERFHTTIAFPSVNYDRSEEAVASLFREHPELLSVAVHGNNHDGREFPGYDRRDLADQVTNLEQAVARMERFSQLTGVPYDRVMIFPHSIGPVDLFAYLKAMGFWGTVNANNWPLEAGRRRAPETLLRAVDISFWSFPSIRRMSVEGVLEREDVAISAFLGNPLLFYDHHDLFAGGMGAFTPVVDAVRRVVPEARWASLGDVFRGLYVQRELGAGTWEVLAFSPVIRLENPAPEEAVFVLRRPEGTWPGVSRLLAGAQAREFVRTDGWISAEIRLRADEAREVRIEYATPGGNHLATTRVGEKSPRVRAIRLLQDFRDLILARYAWGRAVTRAYYSGQVQALAAGIGLAALGAAAAAAWRGKHRRRRGSAARARATDVRAPERGTTG